jgi:transposase
MGTKKKRIFDKEFKINIAKLIINKEKKISELSRELNVNANTLHNWKKQYLKEAEESFSGKGHQTPTEELISSLKRQLKVVTEERDILKKAVGKFSKV